MNTCGKRKQKVKRILCGAVIAFWVIVPGVIFVGGIDIDPVDDKDLLLPENSMPYDLDGNGWSVLLNVLSRVERDYEEDICETNVSENGKITYWHRDSSFAESTDLLGWYVDPANNEWFLNCIGDDREDGVDFLSTFTNRATACSYVESLLKSNEWLFAAIDSVIQAERYFPPPVGVLTGDQFCLPLSEMLSVNRTFLLARVRYEFDRGNYDAGVDALRKALGLATLLQTKCGTFVEYLTGTAMIEDDVSCLDQILNDTPMPASTLSSINDSLCTLRGFTAEAMAHAIKREYACLREDLRRARIDGLCPEKSKLYKAIHSPIWRYVCHPNRTLRDEAIRVRQLIEHDFKIQARRDRKTKEEKWYDFCIPNCCGRIAAGCDFERRLSRVKEIEQDVSSMKSRISRMIDSIGNCNLVSSYFPLVVTNGCYYTHNLKHIVEVARLTESIVIGADVEINDDADFSRIEKIVVQPEFDDYLERWYDALTDPTNLEDVCISDNDAVIGTTNNLVYERESRQIINIYGNEKSLTIPANLVVPDIDKFVEQLQWHGIERLHFCGPLPKLNRHVTRDSYRRRIDRWWTNKTWKSFRKIFEKRQPRYALERAPRNLTVIVSRQHADERTRQIVESGMWEGRPIRWSEFDE